jgi:hypothetical protein
MALYVWYSLSCSSDFCTPYVSKNPKFSKIFQNSEKKIPKTPKKAKKAKICQKAEICQKIQILKKIHIFPKTAFSAASAAFATSTAYLASLVCLIVLKKTGYMGYIRET